MKKDSLDKKIGYKLRAFEESPSADLFARIQESLESGVAAGKVEQETPYMVSDAPKRISRLWSYSGYAAVAAAFAVAVIVGGIYLFNNENREIGVRMADVENDFNATVDTPHGTDDNQAGDVEDGIYMDGKGVQTSATSSILSAGVQKSGILRGEMISQTIDAGTEETEAEIPADLPEIDSRTPRTEVSGGVDYDAQEYWARVLVEESKRGKKSSKGGFGSTLYAGNVGLTQGNSSTNDMRKIAAGRFVVMEKMSTRRDGAMMAPPYNYEGSLVHYMPFTVGLGVSYRLTDHVSLHSGFNYSYLRSEAKLEQNNDYGVEQELHYLGIPLAVSYSFARTGNWDFYIKGGGMLEKAIASRVRLTTYTDTGVSVTDERMRIRGIQLSANGSIGVQYSISRFVGLYIEPGISYYFINAKQPANYRTEHPTNFSINGGLRFTF